MIKAVIFDLNGVFIESEALSARVEKEYEIPVDKFLPALKSTLEITRKPNAEPFFKILKPLLQGYNFPSLEEEFFAFYFSGEKVVSEMLNYVKELRQNGIKVFILSRNFKERTTYYRDNFPQVFENINKAYFSWETGNIKPDPKAYQQVLEENGLRPENCVYFDDSEENIKAAKSLGINARLFEGIEKTKEIISSLT